MVHRAVRWGVPEKEASAGGCEGEEGVSHAGVWEAREASSKGHGQCRGLWRKREAPEESNNDRRGRPVSPQAFSIIYSTACSLSLLFPQASPLNWILPVNIKTSTLNALNSTPLLYPLPLSHLTSPPSRLRLSKAD